MIETHPGDTRITSCVYKNKRMNSDKIKNKNEQINNHCAIFVFEIDSGKVLFSNTNTKSGLTKETDIHKMFLLPGGKKLYEIDTKIIRLISEDKTVENIYGIDTIYDKHQWFCCRCKALRKKQDGTAAQLLCTITDVSSFKERGMDPLISKKVN